MSEFNISFFELMFLAESVIPDKPIARSICFDDFSEKHYHNMNKEQRLQFLEHVQKCHGFDLSNEQCRHFYARYNPENQYLLSCYYDSKPELVPTYMFNGKYHTSLKRSVNEEYVKNILRTHDKCWIKKG